MSSAGLGGSSTTWKVQRASTWRICRFVLIRFPLLTRLILFVQYQLGVIATQRVYSSAVRRFLSLSTPFTMTRTAETKKCQKFGVDAAVDPCCNFSLGWSSEPCVVRRVTYPVNSFVGWSQDRIGAMCSTQQECVGLFVGDLANNDVSSQLQACEAGATDYDYFIREAMTVRTDHSFVSTAHSSAPLISDHHSFVISTHSSASLFQHHFSVSTTHSSSIAHVIIT